MTNEHLDCEETVRRASLYLDGRLSADSRQSIQEHLRSCDACVREYRRFGRLSRATHNLPQRRVVADLAQCVRERVADRREGVLASLGRGRVRFVAAGAAALVLITAGAWWIGFRMGRDVAGDAATPGVAEVASKEDSPKTDAAPSDESDQVETASFETAGRGLLRDLAMIESVDPRARRPLLAAQVSYFDLADDAEKVLRAEPSPDMRELAQFVSALAAELSGNNDIDWGAWRERAQSRGLFREPSGAPKRLRRRSERSPRRMQLVVEEVGHDLLDTERSALAELLHLKQCWIRGHVDAPRRYAKRVAGATTTSGRLFDLPTNFVVARTLAEAGLDEDARSVFTRMSARFERTTTQGGSRTSVSVRTSRTTTTSGPGAKEMLRSMMKEFGITIPDTTRR